MNWNIKEINMNSQIKLSALILILMLCASSHSFGTDDCDPCEEPEDPTLVFQGSDPCKPMADGSIDSTLFGAVDYLCCGGEEYWIHFMNSYDSCCDTDGDGVAETPYDSAEQGCCPKGPNTSENVVADLSCEDADGNKTCPNCDSDGDDEYDDCLAVNPKDANGNPLDDCAAAHQAGIGDGGCVICKDGELIVCVFEADFPSGNPSDEIADCAQCHEDMHLNNHNLYCNSECGWDMAYGVEFEEQCQAQGATEACLLRKVENGEIDENDPDYLYLKNIIDGEKGLCGYFAYGAWESNDNYCDSY
jgi:hypothetical protein